jgi:hypothetical protein
MSLPTMTIHLDDHVLKRLLEEQFYRYNGLNLVQNCMGVKTNMQAELLGFSGSIFVMKMVPWFCHW